MVPRPADLIASPRLRQGRLARSASGAPTCPAAISADNRYVAFVSHASNLVGGDTNGRDDVFVRDLRAGITSRVSVSWSGAQANASSFDVAISEHGQYVAFTSTAT